MNEIVLQKQSVTPSIVEMAKHLGEAAFASQIFGVAKKESAMMIMLRGYELGLPLTAAFEYFDVIDGSLTLKPMGQLALMNLHPEIIEDVNIEEIYDDKNKFIGAKTTIKRRDGRTYSASWTLDEAKTAGLAKPNSNWEKYPKNMTRWRSLGFCADLAAPEIFGGLTLALKMGERVSEDQIDVTIEDAPVIDVVDLAATAPVTPVVTLRELTTRYTPDEIMSANDGKIPATSEECAAVMAKLSAADHD